MKKNIWTILFFILLTLNIFFVTFRLTSNHNSKLESKNKEIELLKSELKKSESEYVENAKQLKYLLMKIVENSTDFKEYFTEYKNITYKNFEEKLRQKIVRLDIDIENIEKK